MKCLLSPPFIVVSVVMALIPVAVLSLGLDGGFLLDDRANIIENGALHLYEISSVDDLLLAAYSFEPGGSTRPLAMLSFALDFWRAGLNPVAFKVTNLAIHGMASVVLALLLRYLLMLANWPTQRAAKLALLLAFLWAVHPMQVSTVLYIVQRMQMLSVLFVFMALLSYAHMRALQIKGQRSRLYGLLVIFFALLGFSSKEDAALLPLYLLVLELTVLNFRAADPVLARALRRGYSAFALMGVAVFFLVVVPYFWNWEASPSRDFSTFERLLTQGRVLVMYLGQILLPLPSIMSFFYDDFVVSRSFLQPWTTLPSIMLLAALLYLAVRWRNVRPIFSLGVLSFFAGHFMTSNVINLELVYEHRNYFPVFGVLLASADLIVFLSLRYSTPKLVRSICVALILVGLSVSAGVRAHIWGDRLRLAEFNLGAAPKSERAWTFLCTTHYKISHQDGKKDHLDKAIELCKEGAEQLPYSAILASNVVIYKAQKGNVTDEDWEYFLERLKKAPMNIQNKGILWVTLSNAERGKYENIDGVLETIEIITSKSTLRPEEYLRVAAYIFNQTKEVEKAFPLLKRAVELAPPDDSDVDKMLSDLTAGGWHGWVKRLKEIRTDTHGGAL